MNTHRIFPFILLFLPTSDASFQNSDTSAKTLQMVHVIHRNGARSPVHTFPNDDTKESDWPDGTGGQLTQIGMRMAYKLGTFLHGRYVDDTFINNRYHNKQLYVRSTDVDRCLQTAQIECAGLYPPTGSQIWNKDLLWQPIPVHTVPKNNDAMLRSVDIKCARREQIFQEQKRSVDYRDKVRESEALFRKLSPYAGMNVSAENIISMYDVIMCRKTQGIPVNKEVDNLWEELAKTARWFFTRPYRGDDELGRLLGGTLLGKINENMLQTRNGKHPDKPYNKFNIFSAHDATILSLTSALDIDIDVPDFTACIMIELHERRNRYYVEIWYRKNHKSDVEKLKLTECAFRCPLDEFIRLTENRTTKDMRELCELENNDGIDEGNMYDSVEEDSMESYMRP